MRESSKLDNFESLPSVNSICQACDRFNWSLMNTFGTATIVKTKPF